MVKISLSGSGEGPGRETGWGYSTSVEALGEDDRASLYNRDGNTRNLPLVHRFPHQSAEI